MSIPIIVISVLVIILVVVYKKQLLTFSKLGNSLNILENYKNKYLDNATSTKTAAPIKLDLESVLEKYNKRLVPTSIEFAYKKYSYPNNSASPNLYNGTRNIIDLLLQTIKANSGLNLKLIDIENITEFKNINGTRKINSIFVSHEIDQHYTRKLTLEYIMDSDAKISINHLGALSKEPSVLLSEQYIKDNIANKNYTIDYSNIAPTKDPSIYPFYYRYDTAIPEWVYHSPQLIKDIDTLKQVCYTQEPCKYNKNSWNKHSVEPQFKLEKRCNIVNHSDRVLPPDPYVNPTLFQLDY